MLEAIIYGAIGCGFAYWILSAAFQLNFTDSKEERAQLKAQIGVLGEQLGGIKCRLDDLNDRLEALEDKVSDSSVRSAEDLEWYDPGPEWFQKGYEDKLHHANDD